MECHHLRGRGRPVVQPDQPAANGDDGCRHVPFGVGKQPIMRPTEKEHSTQPNYQHHNPLQQLHILT